MSNGNSWNDSSIEVVYVEGPPRPPGPPPPGPPQQRPGPGGPPPPGMVRMKYICNSVSLKYMSVSYTHLDVYKRQV